MIKRGIALRYSKAQFNSDLASGNLEKKLEIFEIIQDVFKKNPDLIKFLEAPQISFEDKKIALESLFQKKLDASHYHFLFYLIEKRRLRYLGQIAQEYRMMVNQHLGIWEAKIITAVPLTPEIEKTLKEKLENFYRKKIKLNKEIDPNIIGGAILVVANEMIDWSVKGRLKKMKENLLENGV
jgi:F-type H+-transporting ATPase subunit delta